jgi:hypothetical protein
VTRPALLLVVAAAGLVACWILAPGNSWRYRTTIEVQTPEGVRSGSAVRKITYHRNRGFFLAEGSPSWKVNGEAVVIELPNGKSL